MSLGKWTCPPHLDLLNRKLVRVAAGRIPRLQVNMPPRHGKSQLTTIYFAAWYLGTFPDRRVVIAAHTASLAEGFSRKVRDLLSEYGWHYFGVRVRDDSSAVDNWDLRGREGGMTAVGIGGALTGKGADLLIIDDPVKDAAEAQSETIQEKHWDWYLSTAATRLSPVGAIVLVMTRWNARDLGGRVMAEETEAGDHVPWEVLKLPGLAEENDPLGRAEGEALWPERFPRKRLLQIKAGSEYWFAAMYQQRPSPREGGFFKRAWLPIIDDIPAPIIQSARGWDLAATEGEGDWTAGPRIGRTASGLYIITNVRRFRHTSGQRDRLIKQAVEEDGFDVLQIFEQEPGSGGKTQIDALVRMLAGYRVRGRRSTGSKESRADSLASQAERGNVKLLRAAWNDAFIDEMAGFPNGEHDDQVDGAGSAFRELARYARDSNEEEEPEEDEPRRRSPAPEPDEEEDELDRWFDE